LKKRIAVTSSFVIGFKPEGIYCELDESESCGHIEFALTVPEIKEIIRNKRKEGWKLAYI
jgi:hypothetical protein